MHTFVAGLGVDHFHQHVYVRLQGTPGTTPWWPPVVPTAGPDPLDLAARLGPLLT